MGDFCRSRLSSRLSFWTTQSYSFTHFRGSGGTFVLRITWISLSISEGSGWYGGPFGRSGGLYVHGSGTRVFGGSGAGELRLTNTSTRRLRSRPADDGSVVTGWSSPQLSGTISIRDVTPRSRASSAVANAPRTAFARISPSALLYFSVSMKSVWPTRRIVPSGPGTCRAIATIRSARALIAGLWAAGTRERPNSNLSKPRSAFGPT